MSGDIRLPDGAVALTGASVTISSTGPRGGLSRGATGIPVVSVTPGGNIALAVTDGGDGSTATVYISPADLPRLVVALDRLVTR